MQVLSSLDSVPSELGFILLLMFEGFAALALLGPQLGVHAALQMAAVATDLGERNGFVAIQIEA